MNKLLTSLASALFGMGLLATAATAGSIAPSQQDVPSQGVVIVPASANPAEQTGEVEGFHEAMVSPDWSAFARLQSAVGGT